MFGSLPIAMNAPIFAVAAGAVWFGGVHLARQADGIAAHTGLTRGFVGLVLLATATSLPEVTTTITASLAGNPAMAVNNLTGGIALQTAVLALADLMAVRGALTFFTPKPALLLQCTLLVLLLGLVLCAGAAGEIVRIAWVGAWPIVITGTLIVGLYASWRYESDPAWRPVEDLRPQAAGDHRRTRRNQPDLRATILRFGAASLVVLVAGWAVAACGDAIARQTGLGGSFVGVTLVAASTSLPEVSTTLTAVRQGAYSMAVSNVVGSNLFCLGLLVLADAFYTPGPIMDQLDRSATFAAALGLVLTAIYVWGLLERRDRTVLRMGIDSAAVLVVYAAGVVVLYTLRGAD